MENNQLMTTSGRVVFKLSNHSVIIFSHVTRVKMNSELIKEDNYNKENHLGSSSPHNRHKACGEKTAQDFAAVAKRCSSRVKRLRLSHRFSIFHSGPADGRAAFLFIPHSAELLVPHVYSLVTRDTTTLGDTKEEKNNFNTV